MNSEKVKEIKKALECWQESVMLSTDENYVSHKVYNREILDYINELESENERLLGVAKEKIHDIGEMGYSNAIETKQLKDRIAELEKEIKENAFYSKGYAQGIKNTYEVVIPEKLKQFAERLKEKVHERDYVQGYAEIGLCEEIDETLKEFIDGEK